MSVDKNIVARVLDGDLRYITQPTAVVAVAHASCRIAGVAFNDDDARRLTSACAYVAALVQAAHDADHDAPGLVPAARAGRALEHARVPAWTRDAAGTPLTVFDTPLTSRRPRAWPMISGLLAVALLAAIAATAMSWHGSPSWTARSDGDMTTTISSAGVNPNCYQDAPPTGADLLAVPHAHPSGDTKMNDWWPNNDHIEVGPYGPRKFEATVRAGKPNIWDLVVVRSCLPVFAGRQYRLSLTASADIPVTVRVRVQEPEGAVLSLSTDMRLGPRPRRLDTSLAALATSRQDELMFQVGGCPVDYHLRVTDISLTG